MEPLKPFDISGSPLENVNLIEASAGTGKTYTIAGLYLRLVVEKRVPVEKILVVTFTEAATQELKERIRNRLKDAVDAFSAGESGEVVLQNMIETSVDIRADIECLKDAIRSFDQAAVFTIHGFCQRMLVENAFESGSLFDTELVTDHDMMIRGIIADYWRKHCYEISPLFSDYLTGLNAGPDTFHSYVYGALKPGIRVIPDTEPVDTIDMETRVETLFQKTRESWLASKTDVEKLLKNDSGLNRAKFKQTSIPTWGNLMDGYFSSVTSSVLLPSCFEKFTSDYIKGAVKKGHTPPRLLLFDLCTELKEAVDGLRDSFDNNLLALKVGAGEYVREQLVFLKQEKGIQGFDDLLINLHKGLTGANGSLLAENIRKKFDVALIDEFQDTDPVQYEIFSTIFGAGNTTLFMIGDPKQAIYGFRGADIFAYLEASETSRFKYTLTRNYRSEPAVIKAVNTIFENSTTPFVYNTIGFYPAEAAEDKDHEILEINGKTEAPFHIRTLDAGDKPLAKGVVEKIIPNAVAGEIARLLNMGQRGEATVAGLPLREKDIAVLVRKNREADAIKEALGNHGVPAVVYSTGSVFESFEALELERVLIALAGSGNDRALRTALATELLGVSGEEIAGFERNPGHYDLWKDRFTGYHDIWKRFGFIRAFTAFVKNEEVLSRLAGFYDGERRCTNLLHLSQLIHKAETENRLAMDGVVKWLSTQMDPSAPGDEEHQLRLESDADTVKIVTIHKSKGLEYPVVFCPYTWSGTSGRRKEYCIFHDDQHNMALTLDAGTENIDSHAALALKEELAEDLRLLYVAMTRAKSRCYMIWGRVKGAESTAAAYLLHSGKNGVVMPSDDRGMVNVLDSLAEASDGTINVSPLIINDHVRYKPADGEKQTLTLKQFTGNIDSEYRISSFSSLASSRHPDAEDADRDSTLGTVSRTDTPEPEVSGTISSFPKGAGPGTFMHEIFEDYDFADTNDQLPGLIEEKLNKYGFEQSWNECLCTMVKDVLRTPLDTSDVDFTLHNLTKDNRMNELEFYFPLNSITPEMLETVFEKHGTSGFVPGQEGGYRSSKLDFSPVNGFMKGFIDMVFRRSVNGIDTFYIVDWKSNWLGNRKEDYTHDKLEQVMVEDRYGLQYHLYAVALNRYLKLRLGERYDYKTNFGGVFYMFLRGAALEAGPLSGVFHDTPKKDLIDELTSLFWGG